MNYEISDCIDLHHLQNNIQNILPFNISNVRDMGTVSDRPCTDMNIPVEIRWRLN